MVIKDKLLSPIKANVHTFLWVRWADGLTPAQAGAGTRGEAFLMPLRPRVSDAFVDPCICFVLFQFLFILNFILMFTLIDQVWKGSGMGQSG